MVCGNSGHRLRRRATWSTGGGNARTGGSSISASLNCSFPARRLGLGLFLYPFDPPWQRWGGCLSLGNSPQENPNLSNGRRIRLCGTSFAVFYAVDEALALHMRSVSLVYAWPQPALDQTGPSWSAITPRWTPTSSAPTSSS